MRAAIMSPVGMKRMEGVIWTALAHAHPPDNRAGSPVQYSAP